jgi:hypothetical protein
VAKAGHALFPRSREHGIVETPCSALDGGQSPLNPNRLDRRASPYPPPGNFKVKSLTRTAPGNMPAIPVRFVFTEKPCKEQIKSLY